MLNRCVMPFSIALLTSMAAGQDAPVAASPAELLEQLRAAGVEIPEGFVANEDGSVTVPAPPAGEADAFDQPVEAGAGTEGAEADGGGDAVVPGSEVPEVSKPEWDTKLNIGLNISQGNTEQVGFASTVVSSRKTEKTELFLDAGYFYASEDGDDTENQFTAGVLHDWLLPNSNWLVFADARYDYDDFASYLHRVSTHAGVGYELFDKEDFELTLRAGAGASREFGSDNDDITPEALLGFDLRWDIAENQGFEVSHRTFPSLSDGGEFRTFTTAAWNLAIDKDDGLSFTVSAIHEYLSEVDAGTENNDLKIFAGLAYDF